MVLLLGALSLYTSLCVVSVHTQERARACVSPMRLIHSDCYGHRLPFEDFRTSAMWANLWKPLNDVTPLWFKSSGLIWKR